MIKEGILKKEGKGSKIIERIYFVVKETMKKKEIIKIEEDLIHSIKDFINTSKEKGLNKEYFDDNYYVIFNYLSDEWKKLLEKKVYFYFFLNSFIIFF